MNCEMEDFWKEEISNLKKICTSASFIEGKDGWIIMAKILEILKEYVLELFQGKVIIKKEHEHLPFTSNEISKVIKTGNRKKQLEQISYKST